MAITFATTDPRVNKPHGGPWCLGNKKMALVRIDISGTYETGGAPVAAFLATFGFRWADQMLPVTHRSVNPGGGQAPCSVRFDRSTQKLRFYKEGATNHVEGILGEPWVNPDVEYLVIGS